MSWHVQTMLELIKRVEHLDTTLTRLSSNLDLSLRCCNLLNQKLDALKSDVDVIEDNLPIQFGQLQQSIANITSVETQILQLVRQIQQELVPNPAVGFTASVTLK